MSDGDNPAVRLSEVRERIAKASGKAGRKADDVSLIAISKTWGPEAIRPLIAASQRVFGENRVQEAQDKWPALREEVADIELHMVGSLQSNKAEDAVALFDAIHTVDRPSLVKALAKAFEKTDRRPALFVQVDIGEEDQKGGCAIGDLPGLLERCRDRDLAIAGLMCIPPIDTEPAPYFALLGRLAKEHGLAALSMGMSGDFETAVMCGATHVRVGTALFGERGE
ncbi:MAG: YggS family pyridoxal phosphate-dependent enzyme [Parasphingopyxis sp.]|nr:YggS family pyridoxal phosphate-dependent enzyme [Sphingomonadales bacterium]